MPVIVRPKPGCIGTSRHRKPAADGRALLYSTSTGDGQRHVYSTSLSEADNGTVAPYCNGFVETVLRAWQQDLHLELRPDDVWLAVLTQLSFFVNGEGRAEALRNHFVAHEGKRRLIVDCTDRVAIKDVDVATLAERFVDLVREKLVDPALADWLIPVFTTTLPHDRTVASAVFLGTMQQYFGYDAVLGCGFPSVTLHGQRSDWVTLAAGVARLAELATRLGEEDAASVRQWSQCLGVAVGFMVESFDRPDDDDVRDFWMRAGHSAGEHSSGETVTLSGWLTAFAWWRADGGRQEPCIEAFPTAMRDLYGPNDEEEDGRRPMKLGGVEFPVIKQDELPAGVTRTYITFHKPGCTETNTMLLAGSTGMRLMDETGSRARPFSSWWLLGDHMPDICPNPSGPNRRTERKGLLQIVQTEKTKLTPKATKKDNSHTA